MIKSHYTFGSKIIVFVEGDIFSLRVTEAVKELIEETYKNKCTEFVIINELHRSTTYTVS